jgi:type I restriction enzyme R subunit
MKSTWVVLGRHGTEGEKSIYKQFSPDFFELVVIDKYHRSSARADCAWHAILDYFELAIRLRFTTPKETRDILTLIYCQPADL